MDRSDTPTLLLPLLALLAIAFPFAMLRTPAPSGGNNPQATQTAEQGGSKTPENGLRPHSAASLIEDFLHAPADQGGSPAGNPRSNYSLDFMIATVPDPIDSRLPYMFDSTIGSIQRAFEASGCGLDRFDLAWSEPVSLKKHAHKGEKAKAEPPRYRREPSLLLFRGTRELILVFLVGETPTSGLHKAAMASALLQLANFFLWEPGANRPPGELCEMAQKNPDRTIRIMGPTFSGSVPSLEFSLRDFLARIQGEPPGPDSPHLKFRIISGTATTISPKEFSRIGEGGPRTFQSVVPPDRMVMPAIRAYILGLGRGLAYKRIAMLSEGGTAYGMEFRNNYGQGRNLFQSTVINLPFPLHISQLRTASEKQRESQQSPTSGLYNNLPSSIPLRVGESSQPKETPPSFSSLEVSSEELVLSRLLSTISHEEIHAVGILATDVRDIIFLAREIHKHCPGTLVFTVSSDLLYSHLDVGAAARGMLVFTPYPLYNLDQVWTPPLLGRETRVQFPNQDAEGIYNATLALLGEERLMLDYGEPFPSQSSAERSQEAKPTL